MTFLKKMFLPVFCLFAIASNAQKLSPPGFDSPGQNSTIDLPVTIKGLSYKRIVNGVWHAGSQVTAKISTVFRDETGIDRVEESKTITVPINSNGDWEMPNIDLEAPPGNSTNRRFSAVAWQTWHGLRSEQVLLLCNLKDAKVYKKVELKKIIKKPIYIAPPRDIRRN